jgi:hypothetical protein
MFDLFDFSRGDMSRQNFENGAHDFLRINRVIVPKNVRDVIKEIATPDRAEILAHIEDQYLIEQNHNGHPANGDASLH